MKFPASLLVAALAWAPSVTCNGLYPDSLPLNNTRFGSLFVPKSLTNGDGSINFTIVNKLGEPIIAWSANDPNGNAPKLLAGRDDWIILPNHTTTYSVRGPWSGGFQVNTKAHGITGQDSLIEGSLMPPQGLYLDISNVYVRFGLLAVFMFKG